MPEPTLIPLAFRIQWRSKEDSIATNWPELVRSFVAAVAENTAQHPGTVIGHIKGISGSPGYFLRVNCVSASLPVDVEGEVPKDARELNLELALLIYGLAPTSAYLAIKAAIAKIEQVFGCDARLEPHDGHDNRYAREAAE